MNHITRHNYENFFLLYVDNELSVTEKRAVDEFVQTNPDLQDELLLLQQSILKPDQTVFEDKRLLFKNESIACGLQEKLLLHLDNELASIDKVEMEELILTNVAIKKEWDMLQQTKLLPVSTFVFENKRLLYKNERARISYFAWHRVAVAAILIGLGLWGWLVYFNDNALVKRNEFVKNNPMEKDAGTAKPQAPQAPMITVTTEENEIAARLITKKLPVETSRRLALKVAQQGFTRKNIQNITVASKDNKLPKTDFESINNIGGNKTIIAFVPPGQQSNTLFDQGQNNNRKNSGIPEPVNEYASVASFTDNNQKTDNRILFMDEEKIKKTPLGGIFRKVKRVLERNASIKSGGNNIKVANLEFVIQ